MDLVPYRTEYGDLVPSCHIDDWCSVLRDLVESEGLLPLQIVEGVGYSLAMVVRYALGLSAADGQVTVLTSDGLFAWSALATARHLVDAGSAVTVAMVGSEGSRSRESAALIKSLQRRDCRIIDVDSSDALREFYGAVEASHNVICAVLDPIVRMTPECLNEITAYLNDSPVPVHTVGVPPGVDVKTGDVISAPLYSSSTLSLGLPLSVTPAAYDLFGRHYLADLQWDLATYRKLSYAAAPLFREQPVIKLLTGGNTVK